VRSVGWKLRSWSFRRSTWVGCVVCENRMIPRYNAISFLLARSCALLSSHVVKPRKDTRR
jgi:hypothetical protein